jgi:hypothetical protein
MSTRSGFSINGVHFHQCDATRGSSLQTFLFLNGKRVSRATYSEALEAAKAAEAAATAAAEAAAAAPATAEPAPTKPRRQGLRDAALAAIAAWRAGRGLEDGLGFALAGLEAALAKPAPAATPRAPREARGDSKQATVIGMLQREGGASNIEIQATTGWQPHTVRGFLAGLKKRGRQVDVIDRVRMVGPNRGGAKGSFTVYRIPAA